MHRSEISRGCIDLYHSFGISLQGDEDGPAWQFYNGLGFMVGGSISVRVYEALTCPLEDVPLLLARSQPRGWLSYEDLITQAFADLYRERLRRGA